MPKYIYVENDPGLVFRGMKHANDVIDTELIEVEEELQKLGTHEIKFEWTTALKPDFIMPVVSYWRRVPHDEWFRFKMKYKVVPKHYHTLRDAVRSCKTLDTLNFFITRIKL